MNAFSNFRPFRRRSTYDAYIGFFIVAMDSGSPHHYFHAPFPMFRLSGYDFTTLCTPHDYSRVTHSGVLARVLPTAWQAAMRDFSFPALTLYGRGISPLILKYEFCTVSSCSQVLLHGAFRVSCRTTPYAQRFERFL